ncbi:MAG TPA: TlpA disulfide reductase family protein, partial [Burkholderiales bacterium]|nr:TlpA disulfide reductase family protein [Burkholderiales bacterium]
HRLADYRGRVILINFWATWCGPCRDEMPSIQRLKEKLAGRPFAVLAVNLDEPESRIRNFLSQMKLDLTVLLDPERKVAKAWNARILPASFVVGPDGRIRYSLVGEINWDHEHVVSRIAELLPSKP